MRTLITGTSSFIGGHCLEILDAEGVGPDVDIREPARLASAFSAARPDRVIHLAALSSVADSFNDPVAVQQVNFIGTLNVLLALQQTGFKGRLLFVSSGDCYGLVPEAQLPVTESQPLRPRNPYAVSKVAAEAACYQWSQSQRDFEIVTARLFNQAGPRQGTRFVLADLGKQCSAIRRGARPAEVVAGDVDVTRDFTDVRDGVRALGLLLDRGRNGEAYNVCSGTERSIREIIGTFSRIIGTPIGIRQAAERLRRAEQRRMCGSFEKLRADTGWEPTISLDRTLSDILNYWDEEEGE